jgi:hypothetical protein
MEEADDKEPNNWVERRARREKILATQSEELWNTFRGAIQDACASAYIHSLTLRANLRTGNASESRELFKPTALGGCTPTI